MVTKYFTHIILT